MFPGPEASKFVQLLLYSAWPDAAGEAVCGGDTPQVAGMGPAGWAPGVEKVSSGAEGQDVGVGVREPPETLRAPQHENQRLPSGGSCKGLGASLMAAA